MSDDPTTPERQSRPRVCLALLDIRLTREACPSRVGEVQANVDCPIERSSKTVEQCALCPRFARIEVHEAGYTLLCRSAEPPPDTE